MADEDPGFADRTRPGDIVVAGRNFGYGHPHYPAMEALRACGVAGVVADSFAPGFWRGETFNGMPLVTCPGVVGVARRGDRIEVRWRSAEVRVPDRGVVLRGQPPSRRTVDVLTAGGGYRLLLDRYGVDSPARR